MVPDPCWPHCPLCCRRCPVQSRPHAPCCRCACRPAYSTAAALTSFALSLLLVYRTNAAYGRWAEMRTACGRMLVHLRVLLRLVREGLLACLGSKSI